MKNVNYVINGVLGIAVVVLFILHFSGKKSADSTSKAALSLTDEQTAKLPVAYINADSLLLNYSFSIDLNERIIRKEEDARAYLTQEARKFQTEVEQFEYRYNNGAFQTQQRVQQEQQRLQRLQQELEATQQRMSMNLMEEQQQLHEQLRDTILSHMKEYNLAKNFHLIFSNSSTNVVNPILYAEDVYDITNEVVEFLNKKWAPANE